MSFIGKLFSRVSNLRKPRGITTRLDSEGSMLTVFPGGKIILRSPDGSVIYGEPGNIDPAVPPYEPTPDQVLPRTWRQWSKEG